MEVLLPLHTKQEQGKQLKLALESSSTTLASRTCRIIENGSDLLCISEGSSNFLYHFIDNELVSLGSFFFRRIGSNQVLSVAADAVVKDYPEDSVTRAPFPSKTDEIWLSADGDAVLVTFVDDTLVIGTDAGYLGMLFVSPDRSEVKVTVMSINQDAGVTAVYTVASAIHKIGSVAVVCSHQRGLECVLVAHAEDHDLTVLRSGSSNHILQQECVSACALDGEHDGPAGQVTSRLYVYELDGVSVLATVYSDAISFTTWDAKTLVSCAAVKNELTAPFGASFWKGTESGCRLYVIRADAHCLMYDVVVSAGSSAIREVVVVGQVSLPSVVSCRLGGVNGGAFLCWRNNVPLANNSALLQSTVEESRYEPIEARGVRCESPATAVLLLEVVPMRDNYAIVCLFSNGECHLSLYGERGTVLVAHEEHPYDATSCLAFEMRPRAFSCVLGFNDGDIRVFVDGTVQAWIRVVHCGAVDKLLWFPKINETDDTLFVSISTEMGTVCFHAGESAAVSRTMSSPSQPLTLCLLDRDLEYLALFSGNTANLWHIPTCRLERAFRSHQGMMGRQFDNLLEYHWASAMTVLKFGFAGSQHYAVSVNVDLLVSIFDAGQQQQLQPSQEYMSALDLMLRCLGESCPVAVPKEDALGEALDDLGILVAGVQTDECVWCTILMLCELLNRTSDAVGAAAIYATIQSLNARLARCNAQDPRRQADALQQFMSRFYTLRRSTPASFRYALRMLVANSAAPNVHDVMSALQSLSVVAPPEAATDPAKLITGEPPGCDKALATLLIVSSLVAQRADYRLDGDAVLFDFLRTSVSSAQRSVLAAFQDTFTLSSKSALLLGLVESYAAVRAVGGKEQFQDFLLTLVREAFSGKNDGIKQASLEALERLVANDAQELLTTVIATSFHDRAAYRPYIIVFLAHLVKNFPYEAYAAFGPIAEIFMGGLSDSSGTSKDESSIYHVAVSQLLRVSVASLPNVSLQQSLQHLAVGQRDGKVTVYNVKTASLVTTFQAHHASILGVAYSGNIVTLDIATMAESMTEIKIWRSPNQASSITSFFGGGNGTSFHLVSSVDVPAVGPKVCDASLLIKYFHLNWLSPQCLEFSSPWHGKIQVSLP